MPSGLNEDKSVFYLTKTLLNIMPMFIPLLKVIYDDIYSPWTNKKIKKLINEKNSPFKSPCCFNKVLFWKKHTTLSYDSALPNNLIKFTQKSLDSIIFKPRVLLIINPNNVHSHDVMSIRMIKVYKNSVTKPLSTSFNDCLNEEKSPSELKKKLALYLFTRMNKKSV